jgi:hypothetical protein
LAQHLDRHRPVESLVVAVEHLAHAAPTDPAVDAVAPG